MEKININAIIEQPYSIAGLYYRYKKTSDEDLLKFLNKYKIVLQKHNGPGTIFGYYPITQIEVNKFKEGLRTTSFFNPFETESEPLDLIPYKKITYLVKSSSRFFLKPDIGEIFDQISYFDDLLDSKLKGICYLNQHELLPDTDGEHFLMKALLLK